MAHKKLIEKLDSITYEDLGIRFDEGRLWEKLELKLGAQPKVLHMRWLAAAVVFLLALCIPLTLLKDQELTTVDLTSKWDQKKQPSPLETEKLLKPSFEDDKQLHVLAKILTIRPKKVEIEMASVQAPSAFRIESIQVVEKVKPQFAAEDISVIQASLQNATVNDRRLEKGRKMSIRAQWQTPSNNEVSVEHNQALKIKLYEQKN